MNTKNVGKNILKFLDIVVTAFLFYSISVIVFHWNLSTLISVCVGESSHEHWQIQSGVHTILAVLESLVMMYFLYRAKVRCYILYFFKRLVQFIVDVGVYFSSVQVFHLLNRVYINSSLYIFPLIVGAFGIIFWYLLNFKELNSDGTTEKKYLKLAVIMILVMVLTGALTNSLTEFLHYNFYRLTAFFVSLVKVAAIVGVLLLVKKIINNRKKDNISE